MTDVDGSADYRTFEHVTAPKSAVYRRVMRVFVESKRRFVVHLRPEDVTHALRDEADPVPAEEVETALGALAAWGNLRADPDTSRVGSVEDFYRRRLLFQLTRAGEAAERALSVFESEIGRRGELQAVALEDIRLRLRSLQALLGVADPDPAVVHSLLLELAGRLDSLAANASAFMGGLQRVIDLQELDEDAFFAYKDRLIAYLDRFVSQLVQKAYDIQQTLLAFDPAGLDRLLAIAARREAGDAAPDEATDQDPAGVRLAEWRSRWSGLQSWFVGSVSHPSQSELLRRRASKAVPDLLTAIRLLQERRTGRSDRSADYRALALWFAQAQDGQAHQLWRAAFGLGTARHLTGLVDGQDGGSTVAATTSWLDGPRIEVTARLRQTGHYARRGTPTRVADRSEARAVLAARVEQERLQAELARRRVATAVPTRLSDLTGDDLLGAGELTLFLRLLGDALAAGPPGADGRIRTVTTDGGYEITLEPLPDGPAVAVHTTEGLIWAADHIVTIVDRTLPPGPTTSERPDPEPAEAIAEETISAEPITEEPITDEAVNDATISGTVTGGSSRAGARIDSPVGSRASQDLLDPPEVHVRQADLQDVDGELAQIEFEVAGGAR